MSSLHYCNTLIIPLLLLIITPVSSVNITISINSQTGQDISECVSYPPSTPTQACKSLQFALSTGLSKSSKSGSLSILFETPLIGETASLQDTNLTLDGILLSSSDSSQRASFQNSNVDIRALASFVNIDVNESSTITVWRGNFTNCDFINISNSKVASATLLAFGASLSSTFNITSSQVQDSSITFDELGITISTFVNSPVVVNTDCTISSSSFSNSTNIPALSAPTCYITGSQFTFNTAPYGGAIHSSTMLVLTDSSITQNYAGGNGGGIYSNGYVSLIHTEVTENRATIGGGIYFQYTSNSLSLQCSVGNINDNIASQGGGVAVVGGILQTNENEPCSAVSNTAEGDGGGLYIDNGGVIGAPKWVFGTNVAQRGGAIFSSNSHIEISGTSAFDDAAKGASLYAINSQVKLTNMQFTALQGTNDNKTIVQLINSSSLLMFWTEVAYGPGIPLDTGFSCDDCNSDLCNAKETCKDCQNGCLGFSTFSICLSPSNFTFGCQHGSLCASVSEKKVSCHCPSGWHGDLCDSIDRPSPKIPLYVIVIISVAGGLVAIGLIAFLIIRRVRARRGYEHF